MSDGDENCSPVTPVTRMEAFSDGVFAVAITLLVLEIKVPHATPGERFSLLDSLLEDGPAYLGYVLSFVNIGIYWVNHHYLLRLIRGTNHGFNLLNLLLLLSISFLPFSTAVLSEYLPQPGQQRTAVMFYILAFLAPAVVWLAMWTYARSGVGLLDPRLTPSFVRSMSRQYAWSVPVYTVAFAVAWWSFWAGLVICVAITAMYLWPSRPPEYKTAPAAAEVTRPRG